MKAKPQFHGSDIEAASAYYHIPKESIVSFGANVNPLGLSESVKEELAKRLDILSSYPDRDYRSLKEVIGHYCHVSPDHIVVGNGSTELISLLIQTRRPQKALLLSPTYSEYERELRLVGGTLSFWNLKEADDFCINVEEFCQEIKKGYDLVIICNPNNPTSSAITIDQMRQIAAICQETDSFLMIDETYVEFVPDLDVISAMPLISEFDQMMILRGVSKFYAAPGLRLGYGATSNSDFLAALVKIQNPWSLNSLGALAGELLLSDQAYIDHTRDFILKERDRMYHALQSVDGIKVYKPYANFILVKICKPGVSSYDVFDHMMKLGMMIRDCSSFEALEGEYFRFCIMDEASNSKLLQAIISYFNLS